ncbi:MAG: hypothetical protein U9N10_01430 [Bacillota bacterium]|nr:hypothetical protein [Bacillota bacterium]
MKKILSIGLVVVIVLSLGAMSFADTSDFEREYGRNLSDEEFNEMRESKRQNLNKNIDLNLTFEENGAAFLASITDLTEAEILANDLPLHEIAENENVLDEFKALMLDKKTSELNTLVENGRFSQEKSDFMLNRIENSDGSQLQEKLGQNSSKGNGRGFNRK